MKQDNGKVAGSKPKIKSVSKVKRTSKYIKQHNVSTSGNSPPLVRPSHRYNTTKKATKHLSRGDEPRGEILDITPMMKKKVKEFITSMKTKNGFIFLTGQENKSSWDFIKEMSVKYSKMYKRLIFLGVINCVSRLYVKGQNSLSPVDITLLYKTPKKINFIDTLITQKMRIFDSILMRVYPYTCEIDGTIATFYSEKKLEEGKYYHFKGIKFPNYSGFKCGRYSNAVCDFAYIITEAEEEKIDYSPIVKTVKHLKDIQQLSLVWDFKKDQPLYSQEEVMILTISCFYLEQGIAGLNLIFCGAGSTKKTTWLEALEYIFDEIKVNAVNSTPKGLVPTHFGEKVKMGALVDSKFVCLIDELFRLFAKYSDQKHMAQKQSIHLGLQDMMVILEHKRSGYNTGKTDLPIKMTSSLIATDNFDFKKEMNILFHENNFASAPIFRRFSFLLLSEESEVRTANIGVSKSSIHVLRKNMLRIGKSLKHQSPKKAFFLWMSFMRQAVSLVRFNEDKIDDIIKKVWTLPIDSSGITTPLMKGVVVLNEVLRRDSFEDMNFNALQEDYEMFEKLLIRMHKDYCSAVGFEAKVKIETVDMSGLN